LTILTVCLITETQCVPYGEKIKCLNTIQFNFRLQIFHEYNTTLSPKMSFQIRELCVHVCVCVKRYVLSLVCNAGLHKLLKKTSAPSSYFKKASSTSSYFKKTLHHKVTSRRLLHHQVTLRRLLHHQVTLRRPLQHQVTLRRPLHHR